MGSICLTVLTFRRSAGAQGLPLPCERVLTPRSGVACNHCTVLKYSAESLPGRFLVMVAVSYSTCTCEMG